MHIGMRIIGVEKQQLGNDGVGNFIVNSGSEKNDTILEQAAVNIHCPFFSTGLFYNVGY
jgi:hypothetical protein